LKRAFIYARYSTDLQNERSVEDQIVICTAHAEKLGLTVVGSEYDRAKSGASTYGRAGLTRIMKLAENNGFDVLIAEAPDRVSRDMADLANIHKLLVFRRIQLNCVNGGLMDTMQIGMHGVMGQMQREEGVKKVRRGMAGVVREGRSAGGRAYGYEPIIGKPGELKIVDEQAAVIRRIFEAYAAGISPQNIASMLNSEKIAPPRGLRWNASTINGNGKRGNGILRNQLYAGYNVWNKVSMVKAPSTGKRISRPNSEADWQSIEVPHLRIVDQKLFDQVELRRESIGGENAATAPRSKRILSGLLKCGCCGGGMSIIGSDRSGQRIQCSVFKESSACTNSARYYIEKIERLVIEALRTQLSNPKLISEYVKAYRDERNRIESAARRGRSMLEKQQANLKADIQRTVTSIAKGLITDDEAAAVLGPTRISLSRVQAELAAAQSNTNVIELHPQAVQRYKENVEQLARILSDKDATPDLEIISTFRTLVESVVVQPRKAGEEYVVHIRGYLASLMGIEPSALAMVAGEGLEPPAQGYDSGGSARTVNTRPPSSTHGRPPLAFSV
jgi:site-specific DNA recombinase